MYNEFVRMYCEHFNLDVKHTNQTSWIYEDDQKIGHFNINEKIISFDNGVTVRKGDLILSILEGTNLHS